MQRHELERLTVGADETIRGALQRLCDNGRQILFVIEDGVLRASLTDGDVRRYLLKGGGLDAPVSEAANFKPHYVFTTERRNAETVLADSRINALPIVDEEMRIVDVVTAHETVSLEGVTIRELKPDDLPMVMEFFDQMAGDTRTMFNRSDVNRLRAVEHLKRTGDDGQIHFAATVKGEDGAELMVGYVFLWDIDTKLPWLGIAVREDWKGHHLGRVLLAHLDEWAKPKGYGGLMLTSVAANVRAHALYERMGFVYHGVYPDSEFLYIKRYAAK